MRLGCDWISDAHAMGPSARARYSDRQSHRRFVERVSAARSAYFDWIADWRRDDRLLADRAKIAFGRARDRGFGVGQNVGLPPSAVNLIERKWFDRIGDAANCGWPERNQIRIAAHEADVTSVLRHGNNVTGEQRALAIRAGRPMQHGAAFEMSAAVNESNIVPKRERRSFPEFDTRALTHDPLSIFRAQEYLRVETFRPFDHRRVKVRMRNSNRADAAARFHFGDGFIVEQRNAIPEQISVGRL